MRTTTLQTLGCYHFEAPRDCPKVISLFLNKVLVISYQMACAVISFSKLILVSKWLCCDGFEVEGGIVRNNANCTELGSIILWVVGFLPATKTQP